MLILSNCLTEKVDEGCIKVANNLVKRLKKADERALIVAFDRQSDLADEYISANKFLLNRELISKVISNRGNVIYVPFPAKPFSTAFRIYILSLFAGKNLKVVLTMTTKIDCISKLLLKLSRASFIVFSKRSAELYSEIVNVEKVIYIKTGVDTEKFVPVSDERVKELKQEYGFDVDKKLILHVGHLNTGRNVAQLKKLSKDYQVLLVISTQTKNEHDEVLRKELLSCGVRIIDTYIPDIEHIYQMSDVYFFPVVEQGRCIDIPLSCMEAASCNKPIVTTDFGEMREFVGQNGFYFIDSFDADELKINVEQALNALEVNTREAVLDYDWKNAISYFNGR